MSTGATRFSATAAVGRVIILVGATSALFQSTDMRYQSNALAQEKQEMHGGWGGCSEPMCMEKWSTLTSVYCWEKPRQSNSIQRANPSGVRAPDRTLIVVDPRRTESAELADIHLVVKPGRDARSLAMIAHVIQQNLIPTELPMKCRGSGPRHSR